MGAHVEPHEASRGARQMPPPGSLAVSPDERRRRIAEAAYFRALQRGFRDGDPVEDWLVAEAEVDHALELGGRDEELSVYHKLRDRVRRQLTETRSQVNAETLKKALDKATMEVREAGEHAASTVNRVARALRKDMASMAERLGPRWEHFSEKTAGVFEVWRNRGAEFIGEASDAARDWLSNMRERHQRHVYRAGDMADAGAFECLACGHHLVLAQPEHLRTCPDCGGSEFQRV